MSDIVKYTEVKLRKIDSEMMKEISAIQKHTGQVTITGAITSYINKFTETRSTIENQKETIRELKNKIRELENKVSDKNNKLSSIKNSFHQFTSLVNNI